VAGFCGWLGDCEPSVGRERLDRMAERLRPGGVASPRSFFAEGGALAAVGGARAHEDDRFLIAWAGTLDGDSVAHRFGEEGPALLSELRGDGPLVILDKRKQEVLLASDRFGVHTLYFCSRGSCVVFATKAGALAAHPDVSREIDPQSIFNYVYFHMVPGPRGVFRGLERLEPGEYALVNGREVRRARYWTPRYEDASPSTEADLAEEYRSRIRVAVRSCLSSARGKVGAFLSGGTDSSTIVGVLRELTGEAPHAYSIGFAIEGYDESSYARTAATHFRADHHQYVVTPKDVEAALPRIAEAYDEPFGNSSAVASYHCAELARADGVGTMLGGDGGDEIFAGNERYAKQAVFDYYLRMPAALRHLVVEPLLGILPTNGFSPLRKAQSYVRQANTPLPDRLEEYNFVTRMTPAAVFPPEFLASSRPEEPLDLLRRSFAEAETRSDLNRLLYLDLKFTLADNDLRKVSGTCEMAGVDVLYPFLDRDLVDFANRVPPGLKLKGTKLRYFFKRASNGFLPDAILKKRKHGFGVPCGRWMRDYAPLRDLSYDCLRSLEKRGYLRETFVSNLMERHQSEHADYYGVMVYVLTMLELWHRKHAP
jgi:asparagine synthase (glutamine-hydrolysing)